MKLLAELQTEEVDERPHRPGAAILAGVAVLVLMLGVGVAMLLAGDTADEDPQASVADTANQPVESVALSTWTAGAGDACRVVIGTHPALGDIAGGAPADLDVAVRSLADALRALPLPTEAGDRAAALAVITTGELAEQAWGAVATLDRDDATGGELDSADQRTRTFIAELGQVSPGCSGLG